MNIYLDNDVCFVIVVPGGGTRGILSCKWLELFLNEWNPVKSFTERVNLFAGTSIGAILAAGFSIGKTPSQMLPFFTEEGQWIFTIRTLEDVLEQSINASTPSNRPNGPQKLDLLGNSDPFYASVSPNSNYGNARLKTVLQSVVGGRTFHDIETNLYMTAIDTTTTLPLNFSNIVSPSGMPYPNIIGQDMLLLDACMSTSAAPVYFPQYTVNGKPYMDGGVDTNNPCAFALTLLQMLEVDYKKICILTVGTGRPPDAPLFNGYNEIPFAGLTKTTIDLLGASLKGTAILTLENQYNYATNTINRLNVVQYQYNPIIPAEYADLDLSTPAYNSFMEQFAINSFLADITNIRHFIDHLENRIP